MGKNFESGLEGKVSNNEKKIDLIAQIPLMIIVIRKDNGSISIGELFGCLVILLMLHN